MEACSVFAMFLVCAWWRWRRGIEGFNLWECVWAKTFRSGLQPSCKDTLPLYDPNLGQRHELNCGGDRSCLRRQPSVHEEGKVQMKPRGTSLSSSTSSLPYITKISRITAENGLKIETVTQTGGKHKKTTVSAQMGDNKPQRNLKNTLLSPKTNQIQKTDVAHLLKKAANPQTSQLRSLTEPLEHR